jgi:hypothetical protein
MTDALPAGGVSDADTRADYRSASWRTSSFCGAYGSCVQVATLPDGNWGIRDSKEEAGPVLVFTPGEWRDFVAGVQAGEFSA